MKDIENKKFWDLVLPGTHDSGAIEKYMYNEIDKFVWTQKLNFK